MKRILKILFVLSVFAVLFSFGVFAEGTPTLTGHSTKLYNGLKIVDTNWAYYDDTKTLEFVGNQKSYNETGSLENCDEGSSWAEYKDSIEHIIVGANISKITGNSFIEYKSLKDVRIESSVSQIDTGAFLNCKMFTTLWINGTERIEGRVDASGLRAMNDFIKGTAVKEVVLSADETSPNFSVPVSMVRLYSADITDSIKLFAAENNLTLINLNDMSEVDTKVDLSNSYKPEGATVSGHSTKKYEGLKIVDTYWAYYADTKTLEFVSNADGYNETGGMGDCDTSGATWSEYKDEIEHIIVGDNISKVTGNAFMNYKSLKDVRLGKNVSQIDAGAFINCENLTTVWCDGTERIEGRADLTGINALNDIFKGTAVKEVVLSKKMTEIKNSLPVSVIKIFAPEITDQLKAYAEENLCDLENLNDPSEVYIHYVPIDTSLPTCGPRAVFSFDEATGVLTINGAGKISDVVNYYGGGSKNSPFFSVKQKVKHVVIADTITEIGKYAFCQFGALETVGIPDAEGFVISNAAFEKCTNLKSIYRTGIEPVEGTADLSKVAEISPWAFANDYLIANVIFSPDIASLGETVFDSNINLANIYGVPGSYAETYASENGLNFFDMSVEAPEPISCAVPEAPSDETDSGRDETESALESTSASPESETEADFTIIFHSKTANGISVITIPIIIIAAAVIAVAAVVIAVVTKKKRK